MAKTYLSLLSIISLLTIFGGAIYRFYRLDYFAVWLILIFTVIAFSLLKKTIFSKQEEPKPKYYLANIKYFNWLLVTGYSLLITASFVILFLFSTSKSIISPWQVVPWYFWLTFIAGTILLIAIILKNSLPRPIYWLLVTGYSLLCFSVAVIIYQIGFGFDPFIHQATEKLIDATGAVYPKPWYYLGQYALIIILHKLTFVPIILLDKLLVPMLAALTLPYALYQAAKSFTTDERIAKLTSLFALIFPFTTFIITTPQNLANLFLLLIILFSLTQLQQNETLVTRYSLLVALSFATLIIHPITGIPAVLFVILIIGAQYIKNKFLFISHYLLFAALSVFSLPTAFYLNNQTNTAINATSDTVSQITWNLPQFFFSGTENFLLNFVYLYGFNISVIITLFIIAGTIIYRQNFKNITRYSLLVTGYSQYLLMSLALLISYLLTKTINFGYLIDYERANFASRILIIAVYFTLPFILLALVKLIDTILQQERAIKYLFFGFLVLLISCSLYFSYPRNDDYFNSRGFSTSRADVDAVNWINQDAGENDYVVLANQQASAAALREFGFKKYYTVASGESKSEIFYYPIPTGDKLYQYYLTMVDKNADSPPLSADSAESKRARKTALAAADLVGTKTVYFVINNYWFAFDKILAEAAVDADAIQSINNGQIYIFKYQK
ncbi:MAG: hypothetical protein WCV41_00710 [Patescibacteria group bacterium]